MRSRWKNLALTSACVAALGTVGLLYAQRPFRARMAAYVTDLSARSFAQKRNIQQASVAFSGKILLPGEVFSLNEAAGPYTEARGFLPERGFAEVSLVQTPGGGVCQVASTLYQAARRAGLEIVERVPHTGPVSSVPRGEDATVVYGYADLKFRNPHPYPVKILSSLAQQQLRIEIWGKESVDKLPVYAGRIYSDRD